MLHDLTKKVRLFGFPEIALSFLGFWSPNKLTRIRVFHGFMNILILSWASGTELAYGILRLKDDPMTALDAIAPAVSKTVIVIKLTIMFLFRNRFKAIIAQLRELLESGGSDEKHSIFKRMRASTIFYGFIVFFFGNASNLVYFARPIINGFIAYHNGMNITRDMPYLALQPFGIEHWYRYIIAYAINSYFGVIASWGVGGVDGLFVQFCLFVAILFRICQEDLKETFLSEPREKASEKENYVTRKKLGLFIEKHNLIMDISEEVVALFTIIIMIHFVTAAVIICIAAIDCIMGSGINIIVYMVHVHMIIFELFVYCIGGQAVYDQSTAISRTAYFEEWYRFDIRTQKMVILIMVRAQKGTSVQVPFFAPNISVFASMLGTAMSYVTILKTFL